MQISQCKLKEKGTYTGKSFSEALVFAQTNKKYDDRLFISGNYSEYLPPKR